jgi:hypothetical protein
MHAMTEAVPASLASDPNDVSEALEIARSLWERGERRDAVRWVRRAVEAADEAGQTARVATLAHAAADLENARPVQARPTKPPPPLPARARKAPITPVPPPAPTSSVQLATHAPVAAGQTRVRVSVRRSVRDEGLLVVRLLATGEAPPVGTREAVLVMDADDEVSFTGSDGR